jgi:hypothetical protein
MLFGQPIVNVKKVKLTLAFFPKQRKYLSFTAVNLKKQNKKQLQISKKQNKKARLLFSKEEASFPLVFCLQQMRKPRFGIRNKKRYIYAVLS